MQVAARSYLASGVAAAVGAGAIAMSPVAPPLPDVHVPAISSAAVNLAAAVDPIEAYTQLIANTVSNLQATISTELADPAPVLQQIIANQVSTAGSLIAGLQEAGESVAPLLDPSNPNGIPAQLQAAVTKLVDGDVNGAVSTAWGALLSPVLYGGLPLLTPLTDAVKQPVQNLLNVLNNPAVVLFPALGVINVAYTTVTVAGNVGQDFVDSVKAGDPLDVVNTVLSGPARITDAFLNGNDLGGGVFGPSLGLLSSLRQARDMIAAAITPPAAASTAVADATTTLTVEVTPKEVTAPAPTESTAAKDATAAETATEATTDTVTETKAATAGSTTTVTDSTKAVPGKTGTSAKPSRSDRLTKARNNLRANVKNVTDGLKKAVDGLSGKTTTKTKAKTKSSDSSSSEKSSSAA